MRTRVITTILYIQIKYILYTHCNTHTHTHTYIRHTHMYTNTLYRHIIEFLFFSGEGSKVKWPTHRLLGTYMVHGCVHTI